VTCGRSGPVSVPVNMPVNMPVSSVERKKSFLGSLKVLVLINCITPEVGIRQSLARNADIIFLGRSRARLQREL
jgi:hypothetical protein